MKQKLGLIVLVAVLSLSTVSTQALAADQSQWSWHVIKEKVQKKIYSLWERFHPAAPAVAQNAAPVAPAAPAKAAVVAAVDDKNEDTDSDEQESLPKKAPAKKQAAIQLAPSMMRDVARAGASQPTVVENRLAVQAKGLNLAGQPEPKASLSEDGYNQTPAGKIQYWFRQKWDGLFNATTTQVQSNQVVPVKQPSEAAPLVVPAPDVTLVQNAQALPAGSNATMSSITRLKNWFKNSWLSQSRNPASSDPAIPDDANIKKSASQVEGINVARVATPAIVSQDKNLAVGKGDIPVYRFERLRNKLSKQQVKFVPLLDVGQEAILDANTFKLVEIHAFPKAQESEIKTLETPEMMSQSTFRKKMLGDAVVAAQAAEQINIPILEAAKKVTGEKIAKLVYSLAPDSPYIELPVLKFADEDLKLLRGLILFEKKDQCHVAAGIFADLVDTQKADVAESAKYHLGVCLHEMNLPTEASHFLTKTIRAQNQEFAKDSIRAAFEDVQSQYEVAAVEALLQVDQALVPKEIAPQVNYIKAKYFLRKGQPQKALDSALSVPEKAPQYFRAQYVASIAEYELNKSDASLEREKKIATEISRTGRDKDILALVEINLGREAFQKGKFKDSLDAFQKVPKENNLWMQSLTEQAWSQLQSKDMAGAIGNMHSIQSPYFNGVYKPESYVVRSIAYLNICQYADAFKSIAYLEHTYQPWLDKVNKYTAEHSAAQTYETVLKQLQGKSTADVDELPFQVIREAARQRDFLNTQESINQLIDESGGYAFIKSLIEKDKKSLQLRRNANVAKIAVLKEKIRKVAATPDAMKNFNEWRFELANLEDFVSVYDFKVKTLKEGEDGLEHMAPKALERVAANKVKAKELAGKLVKAHLVKIAKDLHQSLENDELLKYEVYAGSGENLRYKLAGGKVGGSSNMSDRKPAGMHWEFDGEYWEDEIGNYRSSLKNNCQNSANGQKRSD